MTDEKTYTRMIEPREPDKMGETIGEITDVADMRLDLDPAQKLRTVALMMGIRYYTDTIIKDAAYLELMLRREKEMKFSNEPDAVKDLWHLRPANVGAVIYCAQEFEAFLLGHRSRIGGIKVGDEEIGPGQGAQTEVEVTE